MLNVHRRPDVDAGVEQLLDILPALGVAWRRFSAHEIRVRQLIDEEDGGAPQERRIEIELVSHDAAVTHGEGG